MEQATASTRLKTKPTASVEGNVMPKVDVATIGKVASAWYVQPPSQLACLQGFLQFSPQ
jgi:hypothetical protein